MKSQRGTWIGFTIALAAFLPAFSGTSIWLAHRFFSKRAPVVLLPPAADVVGFKITVVNQKVFPIAGATLLRVNANGELGAAYHADASGRFGLPFDPSVGDGLIISASGYMSMMLPAEMLRKSSGGMRVILIPSAALRGRVVDSAGSPVPGATVAWIGAGGRAYVIDGVLSESTERPDQFQKTTTGADGRFEVIQESMSCRMIAFAPAGFAEINAGDLLQGRDVTLTPWGRIDGELFVGGKPAPDQEVECRLAGDTYQPLKPMLDFVCNGKADAQGHFTFEQVCAGDFDVGKVFRQKPFTTLMQVHPILALAGQTVHVSLGRSGRQVLGRLALPPELSGQMDLLIRGVVAPDLPATRPAAGNAPPLLYHLEIARDGGFEINDMEAGEYTIHLTFNRQTGGRINATGTETFTVPPIPGGYSGEPLKIPDLTVKWNGR